MGRIDTVEAWLTATGAARALGCSQDTVLSLIQRGLLKARRIGSKGSWFRIPADEVARLALIRARVKASGHR